MSSPKSPLLSLLESLSDKINTNNSYWCNKIPPRIVTSYRRLRRRQTSIVQSTQSHELCSLNIPNFYLIKPDCLIIEQWPDNIVIKKTGKEVIVDAMCAAAVLKGAHVFAPGVLGLPTNCQLNERIDIYADLDGQCKRGLKVEYRGRKQYVGTGALKMLRYDLFDKGVQPSGVAIHTIFPSSQLPVVNEKIYPKGQLLLQNLPSIVVGWVVQAKPYEYILDMCAAPGNKTTHLAEISDNKAYITAIDKSEQKVLKIRQTCEIQGVTCVNAFAFDSTKCYSEDSSGGKLCPPFSSETFDKILLDAPCSGLGQRPQFSNKLSPKMLQSFKFVQRKLFDAAVKVLKVGGKLVYSTCTVTVEENEGMIAWVLEKFPCLKLIPAEPICGGPGLPNVGLSDAQRLMVQRFGPETDPLREVDDIYRNTIGFFIAAFTKT